MAKAMGKPVLGCDSHVHIIGEANAYPLSPDRHYTPLPASVAQLQAHLDAQGLDHAVIIQPSVYGTDNRCLLDALDAMPGRARAVAVPERDLALTTLQAWEARGVRGIRLNLESAGASAPQALADELLLWKDRLAALGWHVQIYAPLATVMAALHITGALPHPVVLDHFGLWDDANSAQPHCRTALQLLASGQIYIKLSASYRLALPAPSLDALVQRWLELRPDRLLWASDWPHTQREPGRQRLQASAYRRIAPERLVQERERLLPTAAQRWQVLVDNPIRLYRFAPA